MRVAMTIPTPDADPPAVVLTLRPLADPQERYGHPARSADYRLRTLLKHLLRDYGFRCVKVRPAAEGD